MDENTLTTSRALWAELQSKAGLTVWSAGKMPTYDTALEAGLRAELFGGAIGDFGRLLEKNDVPTGRLLTAFFRALAPFSRMMAEVLDMFETAAASRSDNNLRIAIDVDDLDEPLDFTIDAFREVVRRLERALVMARKRQWTAHQAWRLDDIILDSGTVPDFYYSRVEERPRVESSTMQTWLDGMTRTHRFARLPAFEPTGVPQFDELVADLRADFDDFHNAARERFGSYSGIAITPFTAPDFQGWEWKLLRAAHDFWPKRVVELLALLGDVLRRDPANEAALRCVGDLVEAVATFSLPPQPIEMQIEVLDDILSLPVWQRRHELYAVWTASLITRTLKPYGLEFHCRGGVLSFPFKATHLASIGPVGAERLELWSELRTPAVDPTGDRRSVQPDYRIRFPAGPAIDKTAHEIGAADRMVIECKQYKRSNTRNFSKALTDYSRAAAGAHVLLCNYGPISPRVLSAVAKEVVDRCHPIGQVHPRGEGLAEMELALSSLGKDVFGVTVNSRWVMDRIEVELYWRGTGIDLDLYITTPEAACGYNSPGGLPEVTFGSDDLGAGDNAHAEKITVLPQAFRYDVVVRAHSGAADLKQVIAEVRIRWRTTEGDHTRFLPLFSARGRDWHVATLLRGHDEPLEVDQPALGFVSGSGWEPPSLPPVAPLR